MGSIHINGGTCWSWSHNTATFAVEYRGNFNVEATAQLGKVTVFTEEAIVGKTPVPNKVSTNPGFALKSVVFQSNESGRYTAMTGAYRSGISYRLDLTISKVDGFTYADQITATASLKRSLLGSTAYLPNCSNAKQRFIHVFHETLFR